MIKAVIVCAYLFTWGGVILGAMYLTQTWYPLVLLAFLINFTADLGGKNDGSEGDDAGRKDGE